MSGVSQKISPEVLGWVSLAIIIVVGSIVLLNFKDLDVINDQNATGLNTTIDNFVAGISEPENWVAIVIIAIIGGAILLLFMKRDNN